MPPRLAIPYRLLPRLKMPIHIYRRHFFPLPTTTTPSPQRFTTSRCLPHPPRSLFNLVADIDSYHKFLPYCLGSHVTRICPRTRLPEEAELRIALGSFDETFTSAVTCSVEAGTVEARGDQDGIFERLVTKWVVKDGGEGGSTVSLLLEFGFRNPFYAAVSAAFAPKVAAVMIEAFERRAEEVLGRKEEGGGAGGIGVGGGERGEVRVG